jgi:hypothetical protein
MAARPELASIADAGEAMATINGFDRGPPGDRCSPTTDPAADRGDQRVAAWTCRKSLDAIGRNDAIGTGAAA